MTKKMNTLPKLSMTKDAIAKRLKRRQEKQAKEQKMFRENPDKLAAAIASEIRADKHANENPETYENGAMHWFQHNWGSFNIDRTELIPLHETINGKNVFAPQCASTGCVFGWATSLAGYPMTYETWNSAEFLAEIYSGEFLEVNNCWDEDLRSSVSIESRGQTLLDLSNDQSQWLYNGYRTQEQVLWALDKIAAGDYGWDYEDAPEDALVDDSV